MIFLKYGADILIFLKIIFYIDTLKQSKNTKKKHFLNMNKLYNTTMIGTIIIIISNTHNATMEPTKHNP